MDLYIPEIRRTWKYIWSLPYIQIFPYTGKSLITDFSFLFGVCVWGGGILIRYIRMLLYPGAGDSSCVHHRVPALRHHDVVQPALPGQAVPVAHAVGDDVVLPAWTTKKLARMSEIQADRRAVRWALRTNGYGIKKGYLTLSNYKLVDTTKEYEDGYANCMQV